MNESKTGQATVLIRIFNSKGDLVVEGATRFSYVFSERVDDASFITIETDNKDLVDHTDLQETKQLQLVWGYMGDTVFQKRIVYIWDLKVDYNEQNIRIELECYCKAAFMRLNSSKDLFKVANVDELTEQYAKAYGLDYSTENVKPDEERKPADYYENKQLGGKSPNILDLKTSSSQAARDNTSYIVNIPLKKHDDGIAQANRSDRKTLDETVKMEPIDNLFVDSRDDMLILKRRDFNQKPYKIFTWRGEPGNVLNFTPAAKNADNHKEAVANTVNGWVEEDKEYLQGQVTRSQSGAGVLGDVIELSLEEKVFAKASKIVQEREGNPLDRPLGVDGLAQKQLDGKDDNGNPIYRFKVTEKLDSTQKVMVMWHKRGVQPSKLVLDPKHSFYSAAIDETGRIETKGVTLLDPKEYLPTVESNPKDVGGAGINRQSDKELDLRETNLRVLGDVTLVAGKVITMQGVGRRHTGNYYIYHVQHEVTPEGGYQCYCKLYRTGNTLIGDEPNQFMDATLKDLQRNLQTPNQEDGSQQLIEVPISYDSEALKAPIKKVKKDKIIP